MRSNRTQNVTQDKLSQEASDDPSPRTVATQDSDVKLTSLHFLQVSTQLITGGHTALLSTSGQQLTI